MDEWTASLTEFLTPLDQLLIALLIVVVGWLIARVAHVFLGQYKELVAKRTKTKLDDYMVEALQSMVMFVVLSLSFLYATRVLPLNGEIDDFIDKIVFVLVTIRITASMMKVLDYFTLEYLLPFATKNKIMDKSLIPAFDRVFRIIVWAFVIVMIISNLGYNVTSLVAGLGIGGLAVALAAQDALGNFFGSLSIFADKTFKIGDIVYTKDFQGTVSAVGLRSTRLDSQDGTEIIVPNKVLANLVVENRSRWPKRRVDLTINLTYGTPVTKIKEAVKILRNIVVRHKDTEHHSRVYFAEFADWGLVVKATYWIKLVDLEEGQRVQNEINLQIKRELEKAKIEMAYPTQTLYVPQMNTGKGKTR